MSPTPLSAYDRMLGSVETIVRYQRTKVNGRLLTEWEWWKLAWCWWTMDWAWAYHYHQERSPDCREVLWQGPEPDWGWDWGSFDTSPRRSQDFDTPPLQSRVRSASVPLDNPGSSSSLLQQQQKRSFRSRKGRRPRRSWARREGTLCCSHSSQPSLLPQPTSQKSIRLRRGQTRIGWVRRLRTGWDRRQATRAQWGQWEVFRKFWEVRGRTWTLHFGLT
jgi:hypothetical protein